LILSGALGGDRSRGTRGIEDHRHTGMGRLETADAYVESIVALWELAPETKVDAGWHWLAHDRHGGASILRRTGTLPDGGDFESEQLQLLIVARGRVTRMELFEMDALDAALAWRARSYRRRGV
jgi:hypothetical protein